MYRALAEVTPRVGVGDKGREYLDRFFARDSHGELRPAVRGPQVTGDRGADVQRPAGLLASPLRDAGHDVGVPAKSGVEGEPMPVGQAEPDLAGASIFNGVQEVGRGFARAVGDAQRPAP